MGGGGSCAWADDVALDETNFSDKNFRQLITDKFDTNSDGKLDADEIAAAKYLEEWDGYTLLDDDDDTTKQITTFKGIEFLTALEGLSFVGLCDPAQAEQGKGLTDELLATIDFSKLTELGGLDVASSLITTLDVSAQTKLVHLICDSCPNLTAINFGDKKHALLEELNCTPCAQLKEIDISMCPLIIDDYLKYKNEEYQGGFMYDEGLTVIYDNNLFHSKTLMLSGTLGMYFLMRLKADDETAFENLYGGSYMSFTVSGKTTDVPITDAKEITITEDGKEVTLYGFRCEVTSIQMAEEITAVFHYGDGQTAEDTYRVRDYLDIIHRTRDSEMAKVYEKEVEELAGAIEDYGHYAQIALDQIHDWKTGTDYEEILKAAEEKVVQKGTAPYTYNEVEAITDGNNDSKYDEDGNYKEYPNASAYDPVVNVGNSGLTVEGYTLDLNTNTTLVIEFTPADGVEITGAKFDDDVADWDGGACTFEGNYVNIADIPAHELATARTIEITTDNGTLTISNLSALSYVQKILAADEETQAAFNKDYGEGYYTKLKNAVTALYHYYDKTNAYRSNAEVYNKYNN